jgi:hypothetical protein
MGMKSEFLKYGFCLKFNILISDEECLDAENVESYRIIVRFMILYLKLEFLVLFWPKIVFFRYGSRGFFFLQPGQSDPSGG